MEFEPSRLRRGEVIVGASAIVLLALMFVAPWYGFSGEAERSARALGVSTTVTGWQQLTTLRWLMLVTIVAALALTVFQGTRAAPALPASLSVITLVLSVITSLALIYRLIESPAPLLSPKVGAFLGLLAALVMSYGAFRSLREEDPLDPARSAAIPTVGLRS
jgi:hypothetical protein